MRNINSQIYGKTRLISLKEFLEKCVPIHTADKPDYGFNTLVDIPMPPDEADGDSSYLTRYIRLLKGNRNDILTSHLLLQARSQVTFAADAMTVFEDMILSHMEEFGSASFLVRVSPRKWLVADPDDYRVVKYGDYYGLVCYAENRALLFEVSRMTRKQAERMVAGLK